MVRQLGCFTYHSAAFCLTLINSFGAANVFLFCFYKQVAKKGSALMHNHHATNRRALLAGERSELAGSLEAGAASWLNLNCTPNLTLHPAKQAGRTRVIIHLSLGNPFQFSRALCYLFLT